MSEPLKTSQASERSPAYLQYRFENAKAAGSVRYILPQVLALCPALSPATRVLDVGCGNGAMAGEFLSRGCRVVGIDLSQSGIEQARRAHPGARFELLTADANLLEKLGEAPFDLVLSTEVVEHVWDPRSYGRGCFAATAPGGRFICSTPYHGYLKNLMISVAGQWDWHANPLWDSGHIKLWSRSTLQTLLEECGFENLQFRGAGRWPYLWKSMVFGADRPRG